MEYTTFCQLFQKSVDVATLWHGDQKYGKNPYIYHLWEVHDAVVDRYGREAYVERIVAMLHDVLEDTDYTFGALYVDFGHTIAEAVVAMTKDDQDDYFEYIERVRLNPAARKVKLCDSFSNLKHSFKAGSHKRIVKYTTVLQLLEAD